MRWLVTAGGTLVPIDRVRAITNGFTGRTGAAIAREAGRRGRSVTLLTSHPDNAGDDSIDVRGYRTFDDLHRLMETELRRGDVTVLIHSAAVSDYTAAGVFAPAAGSRFDPATLAWSTSAQLNDRSAGKVKSDEAELWLRLVKAPKLVDLVRSEWGFRGMLVKFKLEVGTSDEELMAIAERSRVHSSADLMVANTLEGSRDCAWIGPLNGRYERIARSELAARLVAAVETERARRTNG